MKKKPKEIGEISEAAALAILIEYGYSVSLPFGDNQRYDMIIDDGRKLHRVQVKTARNRTEGSIVFNTSSTHPISGKVTLYAGQIEAFLVYYPRLRSVYWVPLSECTGPQKALRLLPTKNNQKDGVKWARDYELKPNEG